MDHTNGPEPEVKDEGDDTDEYSDEEPSYRSRPQLAQPSIVLRSLEYLAKGLETGLIDVDPEYQREVVWTADRMTGLINSIMENYYIPPIILNRRTHADSTTTTGDKPKYTMVCVDGKQRLSSVRAFITGIIPCRDYRGERWWFCKTGTGPRKNVFPEEMRQVFLRKEFVAYEYVDLSMDQEEDLFARVQMGIQLTAAEKMRAVSGPWQQLANLFVEDFKDVFSLLRDQNRSKDFQMALACFSQIIEVQHPTAANGEPGLQTRVKELQRLITRELDDGGRSHLASVFRKFSGLIRLDPELFHNQSKSLRGVQTFSPIEMVAVSVLISMYADKRDDRTLLGDIKYLREHVREHFADLRMNNPVWNFLWECLDGLERVRGAADGSTVSACPVREDWTAAPPTPLETQTRSSGTSGAQATTGFASPASSSVRKRAVSSAVQVDGPKRARGKKVISQTYELHPHQPPAPMAHTQQYYYTSQPPVHPAPAHFTYSSDQGGEAKALFSASQNPVNNFTVQIPSNTQAPNPALPSPLSPASYQNPYGHPGQPMPLANPQNPYGHPGQPMSPTNPQNPYGHPGQPMSPANPQNPYGHPGQPMPPANPQNPYGHPGQPMSPANPQGPYGQPGPPWPNPTAGQTYGQTNPAAHPAGGMYPPNAGNVYALWQKRDDTPGLASQGLKEQFMGTAAAVGTGARQEPAQQQQKMPPEIIEID